MNPEEKIPAPAADAWTRFIKWLDNFWYHYKWHTLIVLFVVIVAGVGIYQVASKGTADVGVLYAGPRLLTLPEKKAIESAVRQLMQDYNGDGETVVEFTSLMFMSDEQIQAAKEQAEQSGGDYFVNRQFMQNELQKFDNLILAGDALICLLDPYLYQRVLDRDGFMPLSDIFDTPPEGAVDAYGIRLADTKFGQYFDGLQGLPEDTVLCIRRVPTFWKIPVLSFFIGNEKKTEQYHSHHVALFRAVVDFEFPDGYDPRAAGETAGDS